MMSSSRWIGVGTAVLGVGALLAISWIVYVSQSHLSFWSWEGALGLVLGGIGLLMLIVGFFMSGEDTSAHLVQHGAVNSTNYQAGRDINLPGNKSGS
jgi:hypothetical protein